MKINFVYNLFCFYYHFFAIFYRVSDWEAKQDAWNTTITVLKHVQQNAPSLLNKPDTQFENKGITVRALCLLLDNILVYESGTKRGILGQ